MNRLIYLGVFIVSVLVLAMGVLFLCAAMTVPERLLLALVLLALGAMGAAWSAFSYRRWLMAQPAELSARVTELAAQNDGELAVSQIMSAFGVQAMAATAALEDLSQRGQCHRESRGDQYVYVFPGLKEHKVVRKCAFCGSTFPVKQSLQKCPNCGGNLELVKE